MKISEQYPNIFDINFICCFCGFTIFTTFVDSSIGSIIYRAVALSLALFCLFKTGIKPIKKKLMVIFLTIFVLILLKATVDFIINPVHTQYQKSVTNFFLFGYGITFVPMLSIVMSYKKINIERSIIIIFIALFLILLKGYLTDDNLNNVGRASLNNRQSTLAFGDNGAYMVIISMSLMSAIYKFKGCKKTIITIVLVAGVIIGFLSIGKAASRGPLLGCLAGFIYLVCHSSRGVKVVATFLGILAICFTISVIKYIEELSPTLFYRVMSTIENQDLSGREGLFEMGINEIIKSPLVGTNPIIVEPEGNFSSYHNCYLDVAVGLGIIGGLVFLVFVMILGYRSTKNKYIKSTPSCLFIMGMLWFFIFRSLSGVNMFTNPTYDVIMVLSTSILTRKTRNNRILTSKTNGKKNPNF